ncbi:hypothetical protein MMC07_006775 [Pseudocyphellaria aurata]|nr:hypothetical protein [Pseudocyphellaria aurata]
MLSRIVGRSKDKEEDALSQSTRRKDSERKPTRRRSVPKVSSDARKRGDDRDREPNPTSTSHSSTTRDPFSGTGAGSVASSYATASSGRKIAEENLPPSLARNFDQTYYERSERRDRDKDDIRSQKSNRKSENDRGWERTQNREPSTRVISREDNRRKERGLSTSDADPADGSVRAPARPSGSFSEQIGSADFVQFPGQYDGQSGFIGQPTVSTTRISDHVQDQFPGQFPTQSAAPYRPPLGASQGRPGLAADYYGDSGQSVAEQPGVRPHPPSLIVGAQPHLHAASSIVAPPPEPSASGGVGAAASYFAGDFNAEAQGQSSYHQASAASANVPVYQQAPSKPSSAMQYSSSNRPTSNHSSSAPALPTLGAAAAGAAAGYLISSHSSSHQRPDHTSSAYGDGEGRVSPAANHRPQSQSQNYDSTTSFVQSTKPSKYSAQSTNASLYATGAAGAAHHLNNSVDNPSGGQQYSSTTLAQRHRHHGPFSKLVDFFKDPDGVAQFEEYTEYIGVCKYCFTPGSSPRDAPRKHHYRRHRSNERYGGSARVDKDRRYFSSDGETRHKKNESWVATGLAGYGLAKVAESLFQQGHEQSGRNHTSHGSSRYTKNHSSDRKSYSSHGITRRSSEAGPSRQSDSKNRIETRTTSHDEFYKQHSHGGELSEPSMTAYGSRRRSNSRSRPSSKDRKLGVIGSAIGTATEPSVVFSNSRRRSLSPKKAFAKSKRRSEEQRHDFSSEPRRGSPENRHRRSPRSSSSRIDVSKSSHRKSPERRHKSHKRDKKSKGIFSLSNGSSSSSSNGELAFGIDSDRRGSHLRSKARERDHHTADTALMGLGLAATALALNETREKNRSKKVGELVAVKESKHKYSRSSQHARQGQKKLSSSHSDEDLWESASDNDEYASADSNLAYGHISRRASQESISSDSSGMNKWGWRWGGNRKEKRTIERPRPTFDSGVSIQPDASISGRAAGVVSGNRQHSAGIIKSSNFPSQLIDQVPASDHPGFGALERGSTVSSNQPPKIPRPEPVPIQHPQPKVSVPSAVYASQPPFSHSNSAPISGLVSGSAFPQDRYQPQPPNYSLPDQGYGTDPEDKMPGSFPNFPRGDQPPNAPNPKAEHPKPRRRDTSPSVYFSELASDSIQSRRRNPYQDDVSAVRFDLTEEQDKKHRLKIRQQKEEDEHRRERSRQGREDEDRRDRPRQTKEDEDRRERRQREQEIEKQRERIQQQNEDKERRERLRQQKEDEDRRERARQELDGQEHRERSRREREKEDQREKLRQQKEDEDHRERVRQIQDNEVRLEKRRQEREVKAREESRRQEQEKKGQRSIERGVSDDRSNKPSFSNSSSNGRFESTREDLGPQIIEIEPKRGNSWAAPVTAGIIGAAIGVAAESDTSKPNTQREKSHEQKRREKDHIDTFGEDGKRQVFREEPLKRFDEPKNGSTDEKPMSVWQAAAKAKRSSSHEDYAAYFYPSEVFSTSDDQKHTTNANADNDVIFSEGPEIITREPTGFHDSSISPTLSFTPTGDETDLHPITLSWVPKLKVIPPTPTPSRAGSINHGMSPISQPSRGKDSGVEDASKSTKDSKVTWGEQETIEYIPITPMDHRDQFIESPSSEHGNEKETWQVSDIDVTTDHKQPSPPRGSMQSKDGDFYSDDLEFAAVLAAGLEDTGFDPSVVIDDPSFRRRTSPPGSEQIETYRHPKVGTDNSNSSTRKSVSPPKLELIEGGIPFGHVPGAFDEDEVEGTNRATDKKQGNELTKGQSSDHVLLEEHIDGTVDGPKMISQGPAILTAKPNEFLRKVDFGLEGFEQVKANNSPKADVNPELTGFEQVKTTNPPNVDADLISKGFEQAKTSKSPMIEAAPVPKEVEQLKSKYLPKAYVDPDLKEFEQSKTDTFPKTGLNRLEEVKAKGTDVDPGEDDLVLLSRNNTPEEEFPEGSRSLSKTKDSRASSRETRRTSAEPQLNQGTEDYEGEIQSILSHPLPEKQRRNEGPEPGRFSENPDLYEYPSEDALSVAATAPQSNDVDEGRRIRRKSKRRSSDFAASASSVSSRRYADSTDSYSKGRKEKKGLFGFLSRSAENSSESPRNKERPTEPIVDTLEESKRDKESRDRRSSRHGSRHGKDISNGKADSPFPHENPEDDYESRLQKSKGRKEKRRSTGGSTTNDSGRISQDLPAKVYSLATTGRHTMLCHTLTCQKGQETSLVDEGFVTKIGESLPTNADKQNPAEDSQPMSFLGMRQEIPPLPDSPAASHFTKLLEDKATADISSLSLQDLVPRDDITPVTGVIDDVLPSSGHPRPTSPLKPENQTQRPPELQARDENLSHAVTSSPTAIPVNFRRPLPSPALIRSSSLTLVEKHSSKQEPSPEEYVSSLLPSQPSSHSDSRSSSIQDPEEHDLKRDPTQIDALDLVDAKYKRRTGGQALLTDRDISQPDLLDSQQKTPTAPFYDSKVMEDEAPKANATQISESTPTTTPFACVPSSTGSVSSHNPEFVETLSFEDKVSPDSKFNESSTSLTKDLHSMVLSPSRQPRMTEDLAVNSKLYGEPTSSRLDASFVDVHSSTKQFPRQPQVKQDLALEDGLQQRLRSVEPVLSCADLQTATKVSHRQPHLLDDPALGDETLLESKSVETVPSPIIALESRETSLSSKCPLHDVHDPFFDRPPAQRFNYDPTVPEDLPSLPSSHASSPDLYRGQDDLQDLSTPSLLIGANKNRSQGDAGEYDLSTDSNAEAPKTAVQLHAQLDQSETSTLAEARHEPICDVSPELDIDLDRKGAPAEQASLERVKLFPAKQSPRPSPEITALPTSRDSDLSETLRTGSFHRIDQNRERQEIVVGKPYEGPSNLVIESANAALKPQIYPEAIGLPAEDDADVFEPMPERSIETIELSSHLPGTHEGKYPEEPSLLSTRSPKEALQPRIIPEAIALPADDDVDLFEPKPKRSFESIDLSSHLNKPHEEKASEERSISITNPPKIVLPADDVDLSDPKPERSIESVDLNSHLHKTLNETDPEKPSLLVFKSPKAALEPLIIPEAIALPAGDDVDLFEPKPEKTLEPIDLSSHLHKSHEGKGPEELSFSVNNPPKIALPANDDVDLSEPKRQRSFEMKDLSSHFQQTNEGKDPEEPSLSVTKLPKVVLEPPIIPEAIALPADDDVDLLEVMPKNSLKLMDTSSHHNKALEGIHHEVPSRPVDQSPETALEPRIPSEAVASSADDRDVSLFEVMPQRSSESVESSSHLQEEHKGRHYEDPNLSITKFPQKPTEPHINPEAMALPADDDATLFEAQPEMSVESSDHTGHLQENLEEKQFEKHKPSISKSPKSLSDPRLAPNTSTLPFDDAQEFFEAQRRSPVIEPIDLSSIPLDMSGDIQHQGPNFSRVSEPQVAPEPLVSSPNESLGLSEVLSHNLLPEQADISSNRLNRLRETQFQEPKSFTTESLAVTEPRTTSKAIALPAEVELGLSKVFPQSPLFEPIDLEGDVLEILEDTEQHKASVPGLVDSSRTSFESQINPESIALPINDDIDLIGSLPETPTMELTGEDNAQDEHHGAEPLDNSSRSVHDQVSGVVPPSKDHSNVADEILVESGQDPRNEVILEQISDVIFPPRSSSDQTHRESIHAEETCSQEPVAEHNSDILSSPQALPDENRLVRIEPEPFPSIQNFSDEKHELADDRIKSPSEDVTPTQSVNVTLSSRPLSDNVLGIPDEAEHSLRSDAFTSVSAAGKKGKKGKKDRKRQNSQNTNPVPGEPLATQPVISLPSDSLIDPTDEVSSLPVEDTLPVDLASDQVHGIRTDGPTVDNEQGSTKRKGKKGKKSKSSPFGMDPVFEESESPTPVTSVPSEPPSQSIEDFSAQTLAQGLENKVDEEQVDVDDQWDFGKKKGKNGKKSKKATASLDLGKITSGNLVTSSGTELYDRGINDEISLKSVAEDRNAGTLQDAQIIEDEWAESNQRRGKKSKKNKSDNRSGAPALDLTEERRPVLSLPTDSPSQLGNNSPSHDFAQIVDLEAGQKQPITDNDDDEVAVFATKNSKKGKKKKRDDASVDLPPNFSEEVAPVLPLFTDSHIQSVDPSPNVPDITGEARPVLPLSTDVPTQSIEKSSSHDLASTIDLEARQKQPAEDIDDDDEFAGFTKKKGRKGKKSKWGNANMDPSSDQLEERRPSMLPPFNESLVPSIEHTSNNDLTSSFDLEVRQQQQAADDDVQRVGYGKRKEKKGKKSKTDRMNVAASSNLPQEQIPSANLSTESLNQLVSNLSDAGLSQESDTEGQKGLIKENEWASSVKKRGKKKKQLQMAVMSNEAAEADPEQDDFVPISSRVVYPKLEVNDELTGVNTKSGGEWKDDQSSPSDETTAEVPTQAKSLSNILDPTHLKRTLDDGMVENGKLEGESGDVFEGQKRQEASSGHENPTEVSMQTKRLSITFDEADLDKHVDDGSAGARKKTMENGSGENQEPELSGLKPKVLEVEQSEPDSILEKNKMQNASITDENPAETSTQTAGEDGGDSRENLGKALTQATFTHEGVSGANREPELRGLEAKVLEVEQSEPESILEKNEMHDASLRDENPAETSTQIAGEDGGDSRENLGEALTQATFTHEGVSGANWEPEHHRFEPKVPEAERSLAESISKGRKEASSEDIAEAGAKPQNLPGHLSEKYLSERSTAVQMSPDQSSPSEKPRLLGLEYTLTKTDGLSKRSEKLETENASSETDETHGQISIELPTNKGTPFNLNDAQSAPFVESNVPGWESTPTIKTKKDKKLGGREKNDSFQGTEVTPEKRSAELPIDNTMHLDLNVAQPTPSVETSVSDWEFPSTKKGRKEKKSKKRAVMDSPSLGLEETSEQVSVGLPVDDTVPTDLNVTQPTDFTEPSNAEWEPPSTKKGKKGKKSKKQATDSPSLATEENFEQVSEELPTEETVPVDLNVTQPTDVTEPSYPEWELPSTKRGKKGKKSKKQAMDSPSLGTEENSEQVLEEFPMDDTVPIDLNGTQPIDVTESSYPDWEPPSTKKGKKGNKKSKKQAMDSPSLGTEENSEQVLEEFPLEETIPSDMNVTIPTSFAEPSIPEWESSSTKKGKKDKKSKKAMDSPSLGTEETSEQIPVGLSMKETIPSDMNVTIPTPFSEPSIPEWEPPSTKKGKKDKKSKKQAMDSPSLGTEETPEQVSVGFPMGETVPFNLNVTQPAPSAESSVSDRDLPSTKGRKDKKSKERAMNSPPMVAEKTPEQRPPIEETLPFDLSITTQPALSTEASFPDWQPPSTKKGKKGKNSKNRAMDSPPLGADDTPEQGHSIEETVPVDLNVTTQPALPTDSSVPDWAFPSTKKGKKDKKSRKRAMDSLPLGAEETPEQGPSIEETVPVDLNVITQPALSTDSSVPDWALPSTKKGEKDKKSRKRAMDSPSLGAEEPSEPASVDFPIDESVPFDANVTQPMPSTEQSISDWEVPLTKKTKKSKRSGTRELEIEVGATTLGTEIVPEQSAPPEASVEFNQDEMSRSAHPSQRLDVEIFHPPAGAVGAEASTNPEPKSVELFSATNLDAGVIDTEILQRSPSQKDEERKTTRADKNNERVEAENEGVSEPMDSAQHELSVQEQAQLPVPEQQAFTDTQQRFQDPTSRSPRFPIQQDTITDDISAHASPFPWEKSITRDSAVHISDSPLVPESLLVNRAARDSGYQDVEASPLVQSDPLFTEESAEQKNEDATMHPSVREIGPDKKTDEQNHQSSHDSGRTTENSLNISVEVDPTYDVSISRPNSKRGSAKKSSGAIFDHDDPLHSDSNQDIMDLQTSGFTFDDPREPSPVSSTTKERSSVLFQSSPSTREDLFSRPLENKSSVHDRMDMKESAEQEPRNLPDWAHASRVSNSEVLEPATGRALSPPASIEGPDTNRGSRQSLFGGPLSINDDQRTPSLSPFASENSNRPRLNTISEYSPEESPLHKKNRSISDVGSPERGVKSRRGSVTPQRTFQQRIGSPLGTRAGVKNPDFIDELTTRLSWPPVDEDNHIVDLERNRSRDADEHRISRPGTTSAFASGPPKQRDSEHRSLSGASVGSVESISAIIRTPDQTRSASGLSQRGSGTPPLRRVDRSVSSDLRLAHKKSEAKNLAKPFEAEPDLPIPSSSTYDPTKDKGKGRVRGMADVFEGWGDVHAASPLSPTRPPSMRRRQSLQILDLETKLDQLVSENRLLQESKLRAEKTLEVVEQDRGQQHETFTDAVQTRDLYLRQKDTELNELKRLIEGLQSQVSRLTEINEDLTGTRSGLEQEHQQRYSQLEADHARTHQQWQQSILELNELKHQHAQVSTGMEEIVRREISVAVEGKNLELRKLHGELEEAKEQVRALQQQILASRSSENFIIERDEDYFDTQCQELCGHVQQWVLRFSKFSDGRACYLANEIQDETVTDRFENAVLDGSDVDDYLRDRVQRRDVFMSVVMSLVWEYIFTRYLFGMDREQRQKLKALEKTLAEVGPATAVNKWRATTLTLLSQRESFRAQRTEDTEAVVQEIYRTLATFLPPPPHLVNQILDSLRKVMGAAVDLSIEMRTQRAEYMMLPPLQPVYDTNGDLVRKVYFNASTMNERSGTASSNEAVEAQQAVVRMVLFPIVVKRGSDAGGGEEKIVVCPAQVLTAKPAKDKKVVRVMSAEGGRSAVSFAPSDVDMGNMI